MLCVKTDIENKNWLIYILEEFKRINLANFEIMVTGMENKNDFKNTLCYTRSFRHKNTVINRSDVIPQGNVIRRSSDIFIISDSDTDDRRFLLDYDLFWNAFIFLSRFEEYLAENKGKKIHSYFSRHPRIDKTTFSAPIVNNLFNDLERVLKAIFPHLEFGQKAPPILEFSHDVDYLEKTLRLKIKHVAKNIARPQLVKFVFSNASYWCFDYWQELENRFNKKSVFYIYSKARRNNLKTWFLDPSYNLLENNRLKVKLKELIENGFEVGLHGSFGSATNRGLIKKEKEALESCLNHDVTKVRQHWLEYHENITPYLHNEFFRFDSTLGWNDSAGFRSGCASRYRPYDHKNDRAFSLFETPQVIMDGNIYYHNDPEEHAALAIKILDGLKKLKSAHVSISWHQNVVSSDYNWHCLYEEILKNASC